jgi:hypothetical protein
MNDGMYLRHKIRGLVFKGSELYQDKAELVEKIELDCKVKFNETRLEVTFKSEDKAQFMRCSVFQYGDTFFKRCGIMKEMAKRGSFFAEEIIGVRKELNELSREIAIFRAVVEEARKEEIKAADEEREHKNRAE